MTEGLSVRRLFLAMTIFVVAGTPLFYVVWRFVNELLLGEPTAAHGGLAALGLGGLILLLTVLAGRIRRWEEEEDEGATSESEAR